MKPKGRKDRTWPQGSYRPGRQLAERVIRRCPNWRERKERKMEDNDFRYDGRYHINIHHRTEVDIVLKKDQPTGKLTHGVVDVILTNKPYHPRGIKVRLLDGSVGRVQRIYASGSGGADEP